MKRSRSASSSSSARKRLAPLVLLALVVAAGGASAQDARVAGARREGKVVWHTALALDSAQRLATRFEQTYGVKVEAHRSGSERILLRVMQELAAGIKNADVVNTLDTGHYVLLRRKNLLARYTPAGAERFADGFRDPDGYAWGWRAVPIVLLYTERRRPGTTLAAAYPRDGVPLIFSPTAIMSFAPHPSAARLFTDFIFTREIQQLLADGEGLYVAHPDVTYPPDRPKLSELKVLVVDPDEIDRRTEDVKKRFVELFGA